MINLHGINSDLEAKLPKIFKNGPVSQSQWLLYRGIKYCQKICSQSRVKFIPRMDKNLVFIQCPNVSVFIDLSTVTDIKSLFYELNMNGSKGWSEKALK